MRYLNHGALEFSVEFTLTCRSCNDILFFELALCMLTGLNPSIILYYSSLSSSSFCVRFHASMGWTGSHNGSWASSGLSFIFLRSWIIFSWSTLYSLTLYLDMPASTCWVTNIYSRYMPKTSQFISA